MKNIYDVLLAEFSSPVVLSTGIRKQPFTAYSENGKFIVLNAKNKERSVTEKETNNFYEEFTKTGSISTKTYQDLTRNASYLLAAVHHLKEKGSL